MAIRIPSLISWLRVRAKHIILAFFIIVVVDYFGLLTHLFEVDYGKFVYPLDVPMEDILTAMKTGAEAPYKPLNKYDYTYTIRNERKCLKTDSEEYEKVVILYVIKSALINKEKRDVIRKTWGWEKRFSDVIIRRIFVVGISVDNTKMQAKILEEHAQNKDMVQAQFIDTYYNNTLKTMLSFQWVIQNCPKSQFIVFSDDDMYISAKNLLKFIRNPFNRPVGFRRWRNVEAVFDKKANLKSNSITNNINDTSEFNFPLRKLTYDHDLSAFDGRLYAGFVHTNNFPMRHKSSKWYITLKEYPFSRYPHFIPTGAYVLSYPALVDLYFTSLFTKLFKFDDVYLGIVAKKCKISLLHNEDFYLRKKDYQKDTYSDVIVSHGYGDPEELKFVWDEQRSLGHA